MKEKQREKKKEKKRMKEKPKRKRERTSPRSTKHRPGSRRESVDNMHNGEATCNGRFIRALIEARPFWGIVWREGKGC